MYLNAEFPEVGNVVSLKPGISGNPGNVVYLKCKIPRREAPGEIFEGVLEEIAAKSAGNMENAKENRNKKEDKIRNENNVK